MSRPDADTLAVNETLARVAVVAGSQNLRAEALLEALRGFGFKALQQCFVGVDHSFAWLGVQCALPRGKYRAPVVAYLAAAHPDRHAQRKRVVARNARAEVVELRLATDGSITAAVHAVGRGDTEHDLALAAELAELSADSVALLRALAAELVRAGGHTQGVSDSESGRTELRFVLANDSAKQMSRTLGVLDAVAAGLQVTGPQRDLLRNSHPSLCAGRSIIASVTMENQRLTTTLGIEYAPMSWENSLRLFEGIHPDSGGARKLGMISGACGAEQVSRLCLCLGPDEPPGLQVWATAT